MCVTVKGNQEPFGAQSAWKHPHRHVLTQGTHPDRQQKQQVRGLAVGHGSSASQQLPEQWNRLKGVERHSQPTSGGSAEPSRLKEPEARVTQAESEEVNGLRATRLGAVPRKGILASAQFTLMDTQSREET